ncbi:hypothetical protein IPM09_02415 [Candidatus Saccharibacteria bacterium]|nr:MAG: hypothetical protein IPM09_02415 [Candidatus Saccharibacteria bacterium]
MAPATNPNSIRVEMLRAGIAEAQRLRDKALSDNRTWLFFNRRAQEMQAELDVLETPKTAQPSLEELLTALYGSTVPLAEPTDWDETFERLYGSASAAFERFLDTAGKRMMELTEQLNSLGEVAADKATDAAGAAQEVFGDDIDDLAKALEQLQATATSQAERALDGALARLAGIASGLAETREAYRQRRAERQAGNPTS